MKRISIILISLIMLFTSTVALAASAHTSNGFSYEIKGNGTATIVGYKGSGDIIIPQMLDGYTVASIGDNAFYSDKKSDKQISVTIPETVKTIGDFSFWNMNIASINIPNSVEYIGKGAFVGSNDCNFRISNNHPKYAVVQGALYDKSKKELIKGKSNMTIPEGITSIGDYACYGVSNSLGVGIGSGEYNGRPLTYLLPSTIKKIGDYAFAHSNFKYKVDKKDITDRNGTPTGGRYMLLNETLQEIGDYAFTGFKFDYNGSEYNNPLHFIIPSSVKEIGVGCFSYTQYVNPNVILFIDHDSQIKEIPEKAFYNSIKVVCYANIEKIGEMAFAKSVIYRVNTTALEFIGAHAFDDAYFHLKARYYNEAKQMPQTTISIPETCETVSDFAFTNCNVNYVLLSEGVESIGQNAFQVKDAKLGIVYLPASLTDIAIDAFPLYTEYEVESGSYAQRWADENAFNYSVRGEVQNLDWLNN